MRTVMKRVLAWAVAGFLIYCVLMSDAPVLVIVALMGWAISSNRGAQGKRNEYEVKL